MIKLNYTSLQHPVEPIESSADPRRAPGDAGPGSPRRSRSWCCRCTGTWRRLPGRRRRAPARRPGSATSRPPAGRCRAPTAVTSPSCAGAACSPATSPPPPPTAANSRRSRWPARSTPPPGSAGTRSWPAPGRGSSAPIPSSGTAAWRLSTAPTRRSRCGCRRCSRRVSPRPTRGHATSVSATTRGPSSSCCWRRSRSPRPRVRRRPAPSWRGQRAIATAWPRRRPISRATPAPACRRSTMGRSLDQDPLFFAAALAAGTLLRRKL